MKFSIIVFVVVATVYVSGQGITLPDGAELIIGPYKSTFNCEGRIYGFYSDPEQDCQVFHVCVPYQDPEGAPNTIQYSFFCGNQTLFDQEHLVCNHPDNVDCSLAQNFYSVNEEFGKIPPKK